jgi:hypothetical protein
LAAARGDRLGDKLVEDCLAERLEIFHHDDDPAR